jgi:5-methylcytosine-specific restriction enzyme A
LQIREVALAIANGWHEYHERGTVDSSHAIFKSTVQDFPAAIKPHLEEFDFLKLEGSTGRGQITVAPWIAVFDTRITDTATEGFYVVYLYSTDFSAITLSLAFGTTQFKNQFGAPRTAFPKMRIAATQLQSLFNAIILLDQWGLSIDLGASPRQDLHFAYQQSSILSYPPYDLKNLPAEDKLVEDLRRIVKLYQDIVTDPLELSVEKLVETVVEPAPILQLLETSEFAPRAPWRVAVTSLARTHIWYLGVAPECTLKCSRSHH